MLKIIIGVTGFLSTALIFFAVIVGVTGGVYVHIVQMALALAVIAMGALILHIIIDEFHARKMRDTFLP